MAMPLHLNLQARSAEPPSFNQNLTRYASRLIKRQHTRCIGRLSREWWASLPNKFRGCNGRTRNLLLAIIRPQLMFAVLAAGCGDSTERDLAVCSDKAREIYP